MGEVCPSCLGTGIHSVECESCKGDGILKQKVKLAIKIPKSIDDGMLLRVRERGHEALNGRAGDLILQIQLLPHKKFTRDGYDICSEVDIPVTKAILGGKIEVETIDGFK